MNIKDFKAADMPAEWPDALNAIFVRQLELMEKYQHIEQLPAPPVSLHTQHGNRIIRDFAWRTVEELAESYEAWYKHAGHEDGELHALEEMADAFHFWVELLLYAGVNAYTLRNLAFPPLVASYGDNPPKALHYWYVTFKIGIAMNFLRNKAWKTSQVPTDEKRFREALLDAHVAMLQLWSEQGYGPDVLFAFYFKKSEVNKFRQRTGY